MKSTLQINMIFLQFSDMKCVKKKYIILFFLFMYSFINGYSGMTDCKQSVTVQLPTLVLNSSENIATVNIALHPSQLSVSALSYSLSYDKEVIQATAINLQGSGNYNQITDNIILFGQYGNSINSSTNIATITFDFIGAPGTQTPLTLDVIDIYDDNKNRVNSNTQILNGNISRSCSSNSIGGCTNNRYEEFDPLANCDDGTCQTLLCQNINYQKMRDFDISYFTSGISSDGKRIFVVENSALKLYEAQNGAWVQIASDLQESGIFYMNGSGDRLVKTEWISSTSHYIKTYDLINNSWVKVGVDLHLNNSHRISLSENGDHLLVAYSNISPGKVEVFERTSNSWQQKGNELWGPLNTSGFAQNNDISGDGNIIVFSTENTNNGAWQVYQFINNSWVQLGNSLMISNSNAYPKTCKIADNGKTILLAEYKSGPVGQSGTYITYSDWSGSSWNQRGISIFKQGQSGRIELSGDASTFGVYGYHTIGLSIYKWNGTESILVKEIFPESFDEHIFHGLSYDGNAFFMGGLGDNTPNFYEFYSNDCHAVRQEVCIDTYELEGLIPSDTYSSGNTIQTNGLVDSNSGGDVELESENSVLLLPGFRARDEVDFEIKIKDCIPNN